ncbi:hypothetical protein [Bartonella sp. CM120XJJH]|uniref:hypothetical protein n=1 Tax=Bartonella sp. CM120XJJH TaxID=3243544 RepID=UPI0035D001CD
MQENRNEVAFSLPPLEPSAKPAPIDFFDIFFKAQPLPFHKAFVRKLSSVNISSQYTSPKGAQQIRNQLKGATISFFQGSAPY